jgi:tRNA threonylcarbamoyladenosine biosynthesis protein TsaE
VPDAPSREFALADEAATARLGAAIAGALQPGDAVLLSGPLGAGKSSLARSLIRALTTPDEPVPSPTFTLVQSYEGEGFPIAHFDLYRLAHASEVDELGLWDALDVGAAVIEWPERLEEAPPDRLVVEMRFAEAGRVARATGHGAWRSRVAQLSC